MNKTTIFATLLMALLLSGLQISDIIAEDSQLADLDCGFTKDFSKFLKSKGLSSLDRTDIKCASFGGKSDANETITNRPVIFIHGNSDIGFGRGS